MTDKYSYMKWEVMTRVRAVRFMRMVINRYSLKVAAVLAGISSLATLVSVERIIANMPSLTAIDGQYSFWTTALTKTSMPVQLLLAGVTVFFAWFIRDIVRGFRDQKQLRRVRVIA